MKKVALLLLLVLLILGFVVSLVADFNPLQRAESKLNNLEIELQALSQYIDPLQRKWHEIAFEKSDRLLNASQKLRKGAFERSERLLRQGALLRGWESVDELESLLTRIQKEKKNIETNLQQVDENKEQIKQLMEKAGNLFQESEDLGFQMDLIGVQLEEMLWYLEEMSPEVAGGLLKRLKQRIEQWRDVVDQFNQKNFFEYYRKEAETMDSVIFTIRNFQREIHSRFLMIQELEKQLKWQIQKEKGLEEQAEIRVEKEYRVPNVLGLHHPAAKETVRKNGFYPVLYKGKRAIAMEQAGHVYLQTPAPNQKVDVKNKRVQLTVYRKPKLIKDPHARAPFYVICDQFFATRRPGGGADFEYVPHREPVILKINAKAQDRYPSGFFEQGAKLAMPVIMGVHGTGNWLEIDGALLLQVNRVIDSFDDIKRIFPKIEQVSTESSIGILHMSTKEGACCTSNAPNCRVSIDGGQIVSGWPEEMLAENFDLSHQAEVYFDCLLPTAIYEEWDSPKIYILRYFQDEIMMGSPAGNQILSLVKHHELDFIHSLRAYPWLRTGARWALDGFVSILVVMDPYSPITKEKFDFLFKGIAFLLQPWIPDKKPVQPQGVHFLF